MTSQKPNIVLCTTDQLRPFELNCYGGEGVNTPNLDALARRGTVWDTAITNFPVCLPARSALISGQHNRTATGGCTNISYEARKRDFAMPEYPYTGRPHLRDRTLAECLRDVGYDTYAIGKWHIHSWPHDIGFDDYVIPRVHHAHTGQLFTRNGGPEFSPVGYSLDFEAAEANRLLKERTSDRPFFLYYNISPPHCPLADMPEAYRTMYDKAAIQLRGNVSAESDIDWDYWFSVYRWDFRYYSFQLPHTLKLPENYDIRNLTAEYLGAVTWMDTALGALLNSLDAAGLSEDTVFIFTSDHGDNLGSHGLVQKGTANDESIRIPLVFAGPKISANHRISTGVASLVDLLPTILDLAGASVPEHCHGSSLTPELCRQVESNDRVAFFETKDGSGVRSDQHTYFVPWISDRTLAAEPAKVFDNVADPLQLMNLAPDGTFADLDQMLREFDSRTPWSSMEAEPS